jgi:hypothetical protein
LVKGLSGDIGAGLICSVNNKLLLVRNYARRIEVDATYRIRVERRIECGTVVGARQEADLGH